MGLYIAAGLTTAVVVLLLGGLICVEGRRGCKFWPLLLVPLPLSLAVNQLVKVPVWELAKRVGGITSWQAGPLWGVLFLHFLAPVTEEGIKLLPLAVPAWRGWMEDRRSALFVGFTLGTGFGIGEIWYLAWLTGSRMPVVAGQPLWYSIGEFGSERLLSCFFHAIATSLVTMGLFLGRWWLGYLLAVVYHAFGNLGALFYQWGKWSLGSEAYWLMLSAMIGGGALLLVIAQAAREERGAGSPAGGQVAWQGGKGEGSGEELSAGGSGED